MRSGDHSKASISHEIECQPNLHLSSRPMITHTFPESRLLVANIVLMLCNLVIASGSAVGQGQSQQVQRIAFFVCGDPQYLAERSDNPMKLDPLSEEANAGFIERLLKLPGSKLPGSMGGGNVAEHIWGLINTGDLIDSLDKNGGPYPAMQEFEWKRFLADYGLNGKDGKIPIPVYEVHGNHDGPQGDTFIIDAIIDRNQSRREIVNVSENGLHYSWNWGSVHLVNLGIFVGEGEKKREGHHYAPRSSLDFLRSDLAKHVGESGRPVVLTHHLHLDAPEFDWPAEDLAGYYQTIKSFNVIAIFNGHTHGSPPKLRRWNGEEIGSNLNGFDNFDPDDAGASKLHNGKPVGLSHGLLYVEIVDQPGVLKDSMTVRSYVTRDNWHTAKWDRIWRKMIQAPDRIPQNP